VAILRDGSTRAKAFLVGETTARVRRSRLHEQVRTERLYALLLVYPTLSVSPAFGVVHGPDAVDAEPVADLVDDRLERDGSCPVSRDERGVVAVPDRSPLVLIKQFTPWCRQRLPVGVSPSLDAGFNFPGYVPSQLAHPG